MIPIINILHAGIKQKLEELKNNTFVIILLIYKIGIQIAHNKNNKPNLYGINNINLRGLITKIVK